MTQFRNDDEQEQPPGEPTPEPPCPQEDSAKDSHTEGEPSQPADPAAETGRGKAVEPAGHQDSVVPPGRDRMRPNDPPRDVLDLIDRLVHLAVRDLTPGKRALAMLTLVIAVLTALVLGIWTMAANSGFGWGLLSLAAVGAIAVTSWIRAWAKSLARGKAAPDPDADGSGTAMDNHKHKNAQKQRGKRGKGKKPKKN